MSLFDGDTPGTVASDHELMERLIAEERRFTLEAQLMWVEFARQALQARARQRGEAR
jgi:hypothetical protein